MKFSFIRLIRFRVDNARVFQRVSMNLNLTVGQLHADNCVDILKTTGAILL